MVSDLNTKFCEYFSILPELHKSVHSYKFFFYNLLKKIKKQIKVIIYDRIKGGQLIDYIYSKL